MRTLSRRSQPTTDGRFIMMPTAAVTDARRRRVDAQLARRRALLLRLVLAVAATLSGAVLLGGMWWLPQVLADLGLVGYVGWLRRAALVQAEGVRQARRAVLAAREESQRRAYEARVRARAAAAANADEDELLRRRAVGD